MSSPLDRIEERPLWGADYARDQLGALPQETSVPSGGEWWVLLSGEERDALVAVARAAEEAAQFSRPTEAQMHALRSALSRLGNQHA